MEAFFIVLGSIGIAVIAFALCGYFKTEEKKPDNPAPPPELQLHEISRTWARPSAEVFKKSARSENSQYEHTFSHPDIITFYSEVVRGQVPQKFQHNVIIKLLEILDQHGSCSSVVNDKVPIELDLILDNTQYRMLARVSLRDHALAVARRLGKMADNINIMVGDYLILGLGHDIGKIPLYRSSKYVTGDHPLVSCLVLNGISEYTRIHYKKELDFAVKFHHLPNPQGQMTKALRECDSEVRFAELISQMKPWSSNDESDETDYSAKMRNDSRYGQKLIADPFGSDAYLETADPFAPKDEPATYKPKKVDVSEWFNGDATLKKLRESINRITKNRWEAVSMPNGLIYFHPETLWQALNETNHQNSTLMLATVCENNKWDILFSVVWRLSDEYGAISTELVGKNYYMCPVSLVSGADKERPAKSLYLIPFKADAFGVLPSQLEAEKSMTIKRMVKSIKPRLNSPYEYLN